MNRLLIVLVAAVLLAGCTTTGQNAQAMAGSRIGAVAAGVTVERQPDECGKTFPDLERREGEEAISLLRRYVLYVRGPVNQRIIRCFLFNETQLDGLAAGSK